MAVVSEAMHEGPVDFEKHAQEGQHKIERVARAGAATVLTDVGKHPSVAKGSQGCHRSNARGELSHSALACFGPSHRIGIILRRSTTGPSGGQLAAAG